ncbi:MAG: hypothetical protein ACK500_12870, partial [Flavobacteriales bacterium]
GYVLFRIRPLGVLTTNPSHVFAGEWSAPDSGASIPSGVSWVYHNEQAYTPSINWQVTTTFAEEGKKKEVISFFDGSQRNRQTVTRLNTDQNVVVGESVYDYEGRPVINILPTPVFLDEECTDSSTPTPALSYYPEFNKALDGTVYSRVHFDPDSAPCESFTQELSTSSGASQYYSPLNPNGENGVNQFIPDADGYPMTQVEYTPDNTGRIRKQGGVGPEFQLQIGHETNYYYGSPYQVQLDRLFGSEVGDASHYQKNMVEDPNGQISVSYLDMEGRTIATSLAGEVPDNLEKIKNFEESLRTKVDLLNKDHEGNSNVNIVTTNNCIEFSKTILVTAQSEHYLDYSLEIDTLWMPCDVELCVHCVYDLTMSLEDECGDNLLLPDAEQSNDLIRQVGYLIESNGALVFNPLCNDPSSPDQFSVSWPPAAPDPSLAASLLLDPGSYQLRKSLCVNEDARNFYLDEYLEQAMESGCIDSLGTFIQNAMDAIDLSDCNITCQDCVNSLGSRDEWIANGGSGDEWDSAYLECIDPCDEYVNPCEMAKEMMLADLTPGGQYATFHTVTTPDANGVPVTQYITWGATHALSVLNSSNALPDNPDATWRHPYHPSISGSTPYGYYDEAGNRSIIYLEVDDNGNYDPAVQSNSNVLFTSDGLPYIYPEHLAYVRDFIIEFDPIWAMSLLTYHPEYCYYEVCLSYGPAVIPGETFLSGPDPDDPDLNLSSDISTSQQFDRLLANTWDIVTAQSRGLLDGDGQPTNWFSGTQPNDPFTITGSFDGFGQQVITRWNNYANEYSLPEFAALVNRCPTEIGNPAIPQSCKDFGTPISPDPVINEELLNQEWTTLVSLYASVKAEAQRAHGHHYVIENNCGAFNECFGKTNWSPYSYPSFAFDPSPSPFWNFWDAPAYDPEEPCSWYTRHLYSNKTPRFMGQDDYPGATQASDPEYTAYQMYLQTGQCPREFGLQFLLNAAAEAGELEGNNPLTTFNPEFTGMLLAINDYDLTEPVSNYDWYWNSITPGNQVLQIEWSEITPDNTVTDCELVLDASSWNGFTTWGDILGVRNLGYTQTNGVYDLFSIQVKHQTAPNQFEWADISGYTSCLSLSTCAFSPQETPNNLGLAIQEILNISQDNLQLGTSTLFDNDGNNTPPIGQVVTSTLEVLPTDDVKLQYLTAPGWSIYHGSLGSSPAYIELLVTESDPPNFNYVNLGPEYWFANINTRCENLWTIDVMHMVGSSPTKAATLNGIAWLYTNPGSVPAPLELGSCAWPQALECTGPEFTNMVDLFHLLDNALSTYSPEQSLNLNASFTSQLANYLIDPSTDLNNEIVGGDLVYLMDSCNLVIGNIAGFLGDVTGIQSIDTHGEADELGNYYEFIFEATLSNGSSQIFIGSSCIPVRSCGVFCPDSDFTPPLPLTFSALETAERYMEDFSVDAFETYASSIAEFNARLGLSENDEGYLEPKSYYEFFFSGNQYTVKEYTKLLEAFQPGLDAWEKVESIDVFSDKYGNFNNPLEEYLRYVEAAVQFNQTVDESRWVGILSYVVFVDQKLSAYNAEYVQYIENYEGPESPLSALEYRNAYFAVPPADLCAQKYESYVNAFRYFVFSQSQNLTCDGYEKLIKLYSYEDFIANDLCCNSQTLEEFTAYVNAFYNPASCPEGIPYIKDCEPIESIRAPEDCQELYKKWLEMIRKYNQTSFAISNQHQLLPGAYATYQAFVNAGLCDCVRRYLSYLTYWVTNQIPPNHPMPVDIWNYEGCKVEEPEVPCYEEYLQTVYTYNAFVLNNQFEQLPPIRVIVKEQIFYQEELCDCLGEWQAYLTMIMSPVVRDKQEDVIPNLYLERFCPENPCIEHPDSLAGTPLPPIEYINPCETQLINFAYGGAVLAYE